MDELPELPSEDELFEMSNAYSELLAKYAGRPEISARLNFYYGYYAAIKKYKYAKAES